MYLTLSIIPVMVFAYLLYGGIVRKLKKIQQENEELQKNVNKIFELLIDLNPHTREKTADGKLFDNELRKKRISEALVKSHAKKREEAKHAALKSGLEKFMNSTK